MSTSVVSREHGIQNRGSLRSFRRRRSASVNNRKATAKAGPFSPCVSRPATWHPHPLAGATLAARAPPSLPRKAAASDDLFALRPLRSWRDAVGCNEAQPNFAAQLQANNIIFRIPTPLFGLGLVENTADATLQENGPPPGAPANASLGITGGVFNISGNDQTITRFGWKAQNKSLLIFVGEAYNVEQGVSNESFPNERALVTGCAFNGTPEDTTPTRKNFPAHALSDAGSDVTNFAAAIRFSAPPTPALPPGVTQAQVTSGQAAFVSVGCANCHSPTLVTAQSSIDPALSQVTFHPYSDFALHHMGALADGITQGGAGPDQFRTAPLWGVGQRLFFLHDGRTSDIVSAIEAHASTGSEASTVIANFNAASAVEQQDLVDFLRSL
jgi:CxxC motif-containing protein (DUF1111 family)